MKRFLTLTSALFASLAQAGAADPLQLYFDFIRRQPQDVSIRVLTVAPDGTQKAILSHNAAQPLPLASSMKIVVLAAYARAVAAGTLQPEQPVRLAEWESYYLPGLDGGAHAASLKALGITADRYGRALDGNKTVPLDAVVRFMIQTSDNAATDLLLHRLGRQAIHDTIRTLGMTGQGDIGPLAGLYTAWNTEGATYLTLSPEARRARDWALAENVRLTPALRDPVSLKKQAEGADLAQAIRLHNETPPHGTAGDYAAVMGRVLSGEGFAPAELAVMRRHLGWPLRVNPANAKIYRALYAKGGSFGGGVLTQNYALELKNGRRVVYSIFFRNLPLNAYAQFEQRLDPFVHATLGDPAAQQKLKEALKR